MTSLRPATSTDAARPRLLSLFTGAGGLDLGFEAAGFENRLCVEIDSDACRTLASNRPKWVLATPGDIFSHSPQDLLSLGSLAPDELEVLAGGPPCQPFSKSSYWRSGDSKRLQDPRSNTLRAYLEVVEAARPRVLLLENVRGLTYSGKTEGLELISKGLRSINKRVGTRYRLSTFNLNAANFGAPQFRERVFLVADRDGRAFNPPPPTHGDSPDLEPFLTAWDAIGNLPNADSSDLCLTGKWAALLPSIPEGRNYLWHTPRGGGAPLFGWRTRFWSFLLKLAKDRPSWTIQANPGPATGPFHWDNRKLSIRELCRLQTIPDDYQIVGSFRSAQRQVGNAVPCILAEILGRSIREQLLGHLVTCTNLTLIPGRAATTRPARARRKVPLEFEHLQGNHPAHAGEGDGPSARLRRQAARAS